MAAPANILIIDDDAGDRALCGRTLKRIWGKGTRLAEALDGETGLRLVATEPFDCLLLDHSLPGINGIEVLRRLRLDHPYLPVIMLDGKGNDVIAVHSMKEGAQDYIAKDQISPPVLERAILTAMGNCHMIESARQNEEHYRSVFAAVSEGIFILHDTTGTIEDVNAGGARMLGYEAGEMMGMAFAELSCGVPPHTAERALDWLIHGRSGSSRLDWKFHTKKGRVIVAGVSHRHAVIAGRSRMIAVVRDLTSQRDTEARLQKLQAELAHVARLSMLGEMSAAIAHEINQPLTAGANYMNAASRILKEESPSPAQVEKVRDIVAKTAGQLVRAGKIIRNLRNLAEKNQGERAPEDLNGVVEDSVTLCLAGMADRNLQVTLELEPALTPVMIDKIQIQQVLTNLIRNSVEAMSGQKRPQLTIATGMEQPNFAQATVSDTGGGLREDVMARLFQPFTTTKQGGMGIGLSISQTIIENHGGRLRVLRNDAKGAAFRLTLPLSPN